MSKSVFTEAPFLGFVKVILGAKVSATGLTLNLVSGYPMRLPFLSFNSVKD